MNAFRAAFLGCAFLLVALAPPARAADTDFATSFCPECWKFLNPKDACEQDGTCYTCGKAAVAVDACTLTWFWCPDHEFWHRFPCAEQRHFLKWNLRTALAMVVSPGDERLHKAAYCPRCRIHPDPMKMNRALCPLCGGRLAAVDTIEPVWFWCSRGLHWKDEACAGNGLTHCCTRRSGTLIAKQRFTPSETGGQGGR